MIALVVFLISICFVLGVGVIAALSDFRGMKIPNIYSLIIFVMFFICYGALFAFAKHDVFGSLQQHLIAFALVLVVSATLFFLNILGAADSKLASAFSVWLGLEGLLAFLVYMSFAGGVLGLAALYIKKKKPFKNPPKDSWFDQLQQGQNKVPYGIAIVAGAIGAFIFTGYFDTGVYIDFVK